MFVDVGLSGESGDEVTDQVESDPKFCGPWFSVAVCGKMALPCFLNLWGAKCIVGEMLKLSVVLAKSTVSAVLWRHGIPPAPQRGRVTDGDRIIVHDPAITLAIDFA